jgi:ABC-2 type transport system permease protein
MAARHLGFVLAYLRLNLAAAMEYRASFIAQCLGMALNDALMLIFWWMYFARFPEVHGWGLRDVIMLWAVVATSFGLAVTVFGNCIRLAAVIVQGQLDYYLGLPKNALLHVLVSRMSLAGWGDVVFGLIAFVVAGRLDPVGVLLYALLVVMSMTVFVAFTVLMGSLAFFIGNAETAASQAQAALVTFAMYPGPMYRGWVKLLLFTVLPAAFVGHVPVELLRRFDPLWLGALLGFALALWSMAVLCFRLGLRRYESGNLITLRG